jgi:protein O-mannosyl-transferase
MQEKNKNKLSKREKHELSQKKKIESAVELYPEQAIFRKKFWMLVVALLSIALYANTLNNGFVLDDFSVIKENFITTQGTKGIGKIFTTSYRYGYLSVDDGLYRPLSMLMFALEWQWKPDSPGFHHLMNVLLYALTGIVLLRFLQRVMGPENSFVALITTLVFIAHPIHTEVVGNIKSRDEILCFLFSIIALSGAWQVAGEGKKTGYLWVFTGTIVAMFSKESAVILLPGALLLFAVKDKLNTSILPVLVIMGVCVGFYLMVRTSVLSSTLGLQNVAFVDNPFSAEKNIFNRILWSSIIIFQYIRLLVFPHPLIYDYSYNSVPNDAAFSIAAFVLMLLLIAAGIWFWKKSRWVSFSIFFFFISLFLFSNTLIVIGAMKAERFVYFGTLSFAIVIALSAQHFMTRNKTAVWTAISLLILSYGAKTIARNADWQDNLTLYAHDVQLNPNSAKTHYYLGNELIKTTAPNEKDSLKRMAYFRQGIEELEKAIAIFPDYPDAYTQIGVAYYKNKDYPKAEENYLKSLKLNPNSNTALNNLGAIYFETGRIQDALVMFQKTVQVSPNFLDGWLNLGSCYGMLTQYENALNSFDRALELSPDNAKAWNFKAVTYDFLGRKQEADNARANAARLSR